MTASPAAPDIREALLDLFAEDQRIREALAAEGSLFLQSAVARGDAEAQHAAYLDDRIAFNERRPQKYGTQFDWDEAGRMSPFTVDDPKAVDRRRRALGMTPFEVHIAAMRDQWFKSKERPPADWHARQREMEAWAREVGWLPRA